MSQKTFFFNYLSNTCGKYIETYTEEDDDIPEEACSIIFDIPKENCHLHIVTYDRGCYESIYKKNCNYVNYQMIYLKIFHQINNQLPVNNYRTIVIDETEEGCLNKILTMKPIAKNIIKEIKTNYSNGYIIFVIDENGDEILANVLK